MPSASHASRSLGSGSCLQKKPPFAPTGTITVFFTICALTRPSTSVRKSSRRSDQRRPPRATGAEPQVHALDPRRVDEDLVLRPRLGQVGDRRRLELERDVRVHPAGAGRRLEVVGAQGRLDVGQVGPQDPVVVEAGHVVERAGQPPLDLLDLGDARLVAGRQAVLARVEPRLEQLHQQPGDVDVVAQRVLDVVQRERRVPLPHVLRVRAQHRRLPPGQAGRRAPAR